MIINWKSLKNILARIFLLHIKTEIKPFFCCFFWGTNVTDTSSGVKSLAVHLSIKAAIQQGSCLWNIFCKAQANSAISLHLYLALKPPVSTADSEKGLYALIFTCLYQLSQLGQKKLLQALFSPTSLHLHAKSNLPSQTYPQKYLKMFLLWKNQFGVSLIRSLPVSRRQNTC